MKIIEVVCGVVVDNDTVLVCQKGSGIHKNKWEFPGGKVRPNEEVNDSIIRELIEELDLMVEPKFELMSYRVGVYNLRFILCGCDEPDKIKLKEHQNFKWCSIIELNNLKFIPGDEKFLGSLINRGTLRLDSHGNKDTIKLG